jgi:hypothetical protein
VYFSHLTDDPILIEESIYTGEDSGQNVCFEAGDAAEGTEDDAIQPISTPSTDVLTLDLDMDNLEMESHILPAKDPKEAPPHEHERPSRPATSPLLAIVSPCAGPAKAQEGSPEPNTEDNDNTIKVEIPTSDRDSESSDDSDDGEYIEECPRLAKRSKRVRFSDTMRHAPYESQETPISPADTFDNESQGIAEVTSDMYESEEIQIRGVLRLKTVGPKILYNLTFYQEPSPRPVDVEERQDDATGTIRTGHSVRSASPRMAGRCRASRGRYSFSEKDDQRLKRLKEEGLPWDKIAEQFPGSTKGSLQVRYSTKLKDRLENTNKSKKRRRSG